MSGQQTAWHGLYAQAAAAAAAGDAQQAVQLYSQALAALRQDDTQQEQYKNVTMLVAAKARALIASKPGGWEDALMFLNEEMKDAQGSELVLDEGGPPPVVSCATLLANVSAFAAALREAPPDAPRPSGEPSLPPLSQIMALFPPASSGSPTRPALEFAPRDVSAIFGEEAQRDPGHLQMNIIKALANLLSCSIAETRRLQEATHEQEQQLLQQQQEQGQEQGQQQAGHSQGSSNGNGSTSASAPAGAQQQPQPPPSHHTSSLISETPRRVTSSSITPPRPRPGHIDPYKLHSHPDVLLCMRAVKWHAQQMGVELLADLVVGQLRMQLWERQAQLRVVQAKLASLKAQLSQLQSQAEAPAQGGGAPVSASTTQQEQGGERGDPAALLHRQVHATEVEVSALEESITAVEQDIELVTRSGRLGRVLVIDSTESTTDQTYLTPYAVHACLTREPACVMRTPGGFNTRCIIAVVIALGPCVMHCTQFEIEKRDDWDDTKMQLMFTGVTRHLDKPASFRSCSPHQLMQITSKGGGSRVVFCDVDIEWCPTELKGRREQLKGFGRGREGGALSVSQSELDNLHPCWSDGERMILTAIDELVMRRCRLTAQGGLVFLLSCLHRELVLSLMEEDKEGSKELDVAQQSKKARLLRDTLLPEGTVLLDQCRLEAGRGGFMGSKLARVTMIGCEITQMAAACVNVTNVARSRLVNSRLSHSGGPAFDLHEGGGETDVINCRIHSAGTCYKPGRKGLPAILLSGQTTKKDLKKALPFICRMIGTSVNDAPFAGVAVQGLVQAVLCGCTISSCSNGVYYSWPADELEEEREAQKKQKAEFKKALEELEKKARQEDKKEGGGKEKEKGRKGGQHKTEDAFARVLKLQDEEEEEEWGQMLTVIGCTLKGCKLTALRIKHLPLGSFTLAGATFLGNGTDVSLVGPAAMARVLLEAPGIVSAPDVPLQVQTFPSHEAELLSLGLMEHITDELQYETALAAARYLHPKVVSTLAFDFLEQSTKRLLLAHPHTLPRLLTCLASAASVKQALISAAAHQQRAKAQWGGRCVVVRLSRPESRTVFLSGNSSPSGSGGGGGAGLSLGGDGQLRHYSWGGSGGVSHGVSQGSGLRHGFLRVSPPRVSHFSSTSHTPSGAGPSAGSVAEASPPNESVTGASRADLEAPWLAALRRQLQRQKVENELYNTILQNDERLGRARGSGGGGLFEQLLEEGITSRGQGGHYPSGLGSYFPPGHQGPEDEASSSDGTDEYNEAYSLYERVNVKALSTQHPGAPLQFPGFARRGAGRPGAGGGGSVWGRVDTSSSSVSDSDSDSDSGMSGSGHEEVEQEREVEQQGLGGEKLQPAAGNDNRARSATAGEVEVRPATSGLHEARGPHTVLDLSRPEEADTAGGLTSGAAGAGSTPQQRPPAPAASGAAAAAAPTVDNNSTSHSGPAASRRSSGDVVAGPAVSSVAAGRLHADNNSSGSSSSSSSSTTALSVSPPSAPPVPTQRKASAGEHALLQSALKRAGLTRGGPAAPPAAATTTTAAGNTSNGKPTGAAGAATGNNTGSQAHPVARDGSDGSGEKPGSGRPAATNPGSQTHHAVRASARAGNDGSSKEGPGNGKPAATGTGGSQAPTGAREGAKSSAAGSTSNGSSGRAQPSSNEGARARTSGSDATGGNTGASPSGRGAISSSNPGVSTSSNGSGKAAASSTKGKAASALHSLGTSPPTAASAKMMGVPQQDSGGGAAGRGTAGGRGGAGGTGGTNGTSGTSGTSSTNGSRGWKGKRGTGGTGGERHHEDSKHHSLLDSPD